MKNLLHKAFAGVMVIAVFAATTSIANAASLQAVSNDMSVQRVNEASTHDIEFTIPNTLAAAGTVAVTFPADFDFSSVIPADVTSAQGGSVALSGTDNRVITLTYAGGIAAAATETITIGGSLALNPSTATTYIIEVVASNGDSGEITVPIIGDDQVVITAKVNQTLSFAVSDNAVDFGDLTTANARYATTAGGAASEPANAHTLTAGTNATGGYTIAVEGDTLTSMGAASDTIDRIADAAAIAAGSEQFGLDVDYASGGTSTNLTIATPFDDYGMTDVAATSELLATQLDPTADNVYDVNYVANIAALTEAGSYSTTFTYTMTANF